MADVVRVLASSGTTGTPVFFGLTDADRQAWLRRIATRFFTAGVRRDSRVAPTTCLPLVAGGMPCADGPVRIRKQSATQVRFDDPLPLEVELARPPSDADALRQRIEESIRDQLRVRVAVELLNRGAISVGEYKNAHTYVAKETSRS